MKNKVLLIALLVLGLFLTACGSESADESSGENQQTPGNETPQENESAPENEESDNDQSAQEETEAIEVDKGLLSVEITIPPSMIEEDPEKLIEEAKAQGVSEAKVNDDGSITYKMSKSVHQKMMQEVEASLKESIEETKNSGDFKSIKDITHNNSFSEFTLIVDKAAFENSLDGFAALGLAISGMYYQLFDGVNPDDLKVTVHVQDEASGEIFNTIVYPDALESD